MKFAYADPPYLGQGRKHYGRLHPDAADCDGLDFHRALIGRLTAGFDAWAYSLASTTLRDILPLCPDDVRVGAWCKSFCSFKPNVNPAYAWEPVIFRGGRGRGKWEDKVRDWVVAPISLMTGCPGAKPAAFCYWAFDLIGARPDDEFYDLFPGSGAVSRAWEAWREAWAPGREACVPRPSRREEYHPLFDGADI